MKKVKGFTYDVEKDKDVIEHINKQPNNSAYLIDLVRKDINRKDDLTLEIIRNEIKKYIENNVKFDSFDRVDSSNNLQEDLKNITDILGQ